MILDLDVKYNLKGQLIGNDIHKNFENLQNEIDRLNESNKTRPLFGECCFSWSKERRNNRLQFIEIHERFITHKVLSITDAYYRGTSFCSNDPEEMSAVFNVKIELLNTERGTLYKNLNNNDYTLLLEPRIITEPKFRIITFDIGWELETENNF